jgi:hypothetical protein
MDAQITAVCRDGYRTVPVCSKHPDLPDIAPVQHIGMREAKDVILSTADDSDAGSNGIEEWLRTGCEAAVMGDEQDIAFDFDVLTDKACLRSFGDIRRQQDADGAVCQFRDEGIIVDPVVCVPVVGEMRGNSGIEDPDMNRVDLNRRRCRRNPVEGNVPIRYNSFKFLEGFRIVFVTV